MEKVTLGVKEFELELPESFTARHEVTLAANKNYGRSVCAALGLCSPKLAKMLRLSYKDAGYDPMEFGGQVNDALIKSGVAIEEIIEAGKVAWMMVVSSIIPEKEVAEEEAFLEATPPEENLDELSL